MKSQPPSFQYRTDRGSSNLTVELWDPQDPQAAANVIASFYKSTWGDPIHPRTWTDVKSWEIAQRAADGQVLPNTLESLALTFSINGVARATTHQLVRTRVGAVFGQQGGRDNNWSDFNLRLSETWFQNQSSKELIAAAEDLQIQANRLYKMALIAKIPFQDARYILPMGLETALVASYNLLSFKSLAERRLCNRMMWETNYVVREMADLVVRQYPWVGKSLRSICEKRGTCTSVSPMFPPACWHLGQEDPFDVVHIKRAKDNSTLRAEVNLHGYDFDKEANACELMFGEIDQLRLMKEHENPFEIISLVDGNTVIARMDDKHSGTWRSL